MSLVRSGLRQVLRRETQSQVIYECRRCGTTVDRSAESCPVCGAAEIAQYDIR